MWSITFYLGPNMQTFEAVGYSNEAEALVSLSTHTWFTDEAGNQVRIPAVLRDSSVVKIHETAT